MYFNNNTSSDETLSLLLNIIASYVVCSESSDPKCQRGVPIRRKYVCSRDGSEIKSRLRGWKRILIAKSMDGARGFCDYDAAAVVAAHIMLLLYCTQRR